MIDAAAAADFLERNFGSRLVMSLGDGPPKFAGNSSKAAAREFIERDPNRNVYFPIAEAKGELFKKPSKKDISGSYHVWVDCDPPQGVSAEALHQWRAAKLGELKAFEPQPQIAVDSGRGYWAFWRLERLVSTDEGEAINKALAQQLDGDHCHNIDRVARVPFTRNSKTGAIAAVLWERAGAAAPEAMPQLSALEAPANQDAALPTIGAAIKSLDELDQWNVPSRVRLIIQHGRDLENPKIGDNSLSAWLFDAVCHLLRCGVPEDRTMGILLDRSWGISASVLATGTRAEAYAARQIIRARERIAASNNDFQRNDRNKPLPTLQNIRIALNKAGVTVAHDQFSDKMTISGLPGFGPRLNDDSMRRLWLLVEERFGFRPSKDYFWDVVTDLARQNGYHPVRDYLASLTWDGTPRLSGWLSTYGGADDTAFNRAVAANVLVAAVSRVLNPGCKCDEMLVLEGGQGTCKSSAIAILACHPEWFTDDVCLDGDGKRAIEQLTGKWLVEAAEMAGMRQGEVERFKAFLSRQTDQGRLAYGRIVQEQPRQFILIGTTNSGAYLRDSTGNRRYLPVKIKRFDLEALTRDRDQLWAEAAQRQAQGERFQLDPALWADAAAAQNARRVVDPFVEILSDRLGDATGKIFGADVWKLLDIPLERQPQHAQRMGDAMRELGWERKQLRFGGPNPQWGYVRGGGQNRLEVTRYINGEWVLSDRLPNLHSIKAA